MDIQLRPGTPEDLPEIAEVDGASFGFSYDEEALARIGTRGIDFTVATDGDRIVGVSGDFRFNLTVPGGAKLSVPGVTWVSVLPTHRRRGVLSTMMASLLEAYARAGDPGAILTASEAGIYRRFGYGMASQDVRVSINRSLTRLRTPVDTSAVEFLSAEQARTRLPQLHREWERDVPGALSRDEKWWTHLLRDGPDQRQGGSARQYLAHPGGYVAYRARERWENGRPSGSCVITDYKICTPEAHAAIWQVLLGLDLFATIEAWQLPLDDPLPLMLTDSRQLQVIAIKDGIWLRPIDVAALLSARRYRVDVSAVIEVEGARFALSAGPDSAECRPTDQPPDLVLDRPGLGSLYLGGFRLNTLLRSGGARCDDPALARRLDLAFGTERTPQHGTDF